MIRANPRHERGRQLRAGQAAGAAIPAHPAAHRDHFGQSRGIGHCASAAFLQVHSGARRLDRPLVACEMRRLQPRYSRMGELKMQVELIHFRDPDYECDLHVIVDGVEVPMEHVQFVDIDPGRGYCRDSWDEHKLESIADLSSDRAKELATVLFDAADESKYIEDCK